MVTPSVTSRPVPTSRSLLSSCIGGEQVSGTVMVGLLPTAPATVMSSTVQAASAVVVLGAAVGAPDGVPPSDEEQATSPAANAAAITILPTVRMAPHRRRRLRPTG